MSLLIGLLNIIGNRVQGARVIEGKPPIWVEYIVARAVDFSLPAYDTMQENIVADTDHLVSVQLYDSDNELTANLRPCLSTEKGHYLEGCLYDVVKKKFYYSQNAGVKYGDIVREVEYIESTGTQYIDTGVILDYAKDFRIRGVIINPSTNKRKVIIGCYTANNILPFSIEFASSTQTGLTKNGIRVYFGHYSDALYSKSTSTLPINTKIDFYFAYTASTKSFVLNCVADGQTYTLNDNIPDIDNVISDNPLCMFLDERESTSPIANGLIIKSLSLEQDTISKNYVPSKNSSDVLGMYDTITGTFFTNKGTGEFIAGKDMNDLFNVVEKEGVFLNRTTGDGLNVKDKSLAHITSIKGNTLIFNQLLKDGKVVDMGLPSGTLWATCDIDVTNPDGFCDTPFTYQKSFFSWGNIDGHNPKNNSFADVYNWGSINTAEPWYEGQVYGNTKGNTLTGNIPVGEEFDAARANLGELWRMPTTTEFAELFAGCIYIDATGTEIPVATTDKRVTVNGIVGLYLQSKTNGNRLFFACSGYGNGTSWDRRGSYGYFWPASFSSSRYARGLVFYSGGVNPQNYYNRHLGFAVRAVLKPSNIIETGYNNHKYYIKNNKNIFDLTEIFGAGNEPETAEEFEAMFPEDYYDYDAGSLLNVNACGMKSTNVEKTKWDSLYFIDDTHTLSSLTGKVEGSSVSKVIFPEGMKRIGNVYDELTDVKDGCFTKAVKRIGVRAYQTGDEDDTTVKTDGTNTYYTLSNATVYTLDTPVPCNYKVWKGGSEIVIPENTEALTAPVDMSVKYIVEEDE